jgi:ATP/maltotriose-dependent transcriptional regulator MalT
LGTDAAWKCAPAWTGRTLRAAFTLDNNREWYRYHHLFQELLQQRLLGELAPGEVNDLHCRASAWFEEHGLIDEALQHALAAGDLDWRAPHERRLWM